MRKHQPIWEQIKKEGKVAIAADTRLHPRITKAVIKEKNRDVAWNLMQTEAGKKWKLVIDRDDNLITMSLEDISHLLPININSL